MNLDEEFKLLVKSQNDEIQLALKESKDAFKKAKELSRKYGIPFETVIEDLDYAFNPHTLSKLYPDQVTKNKWGEEVISDELTDIIREVTGLNPEWADDGWQVSSLQC